MSLGDSGNYQDDNFGSDEIQQRIQSLRQLRIPVVVSAGNGFFNHGSAEGMSYPGIFRETVSAGAFYDADEGPFSYASGAQAFSTGPGRFTPFSQRLHSSTNGLTKTDIFGPGAPVTSTGHTSDTAESIQHGTSQAAPIISGVLLLTQEYYRGKTGSLPSVNDLELWMEQGATNQLDGDNEDDNITNTDKSYPQVDAFRTIEASQRSIQRDLLFKGGQSTYSKH